MSYCSGELRVCGVDGVDELVWLDSAERTMSTGGSVCGAVCKGGMTHNQSIVLKLCLAATWCYKLN